MSDLLEKWKNFLNLQSEYRFEYYNDDFKIKIYPSSYGYLTSSEKLVRVYDVNERYRLDNYGWHVFYDIPEKNVDVNLDDDRYLSFLLLRIVSDFPLFYKRKEELEYFDICQGKKFLRVADKNFSIQDCEVFHLRSISEERFYRAGRDDRFEITTVDAWYIKYQKAIIENKYLQSLLPPCQEVNETEYVYATTAIGNETKTFTKDETQTKSLHDNFSMESFLSSLDQVKEMQSDG